MHPDRQEIKLELIEFEVKYEMNRVTINPKCAYFIRGFAKDEDNFLSRKLFAQLK
jgi:hypothetical protein